MLYVINVGAPSWNGMYASYDDGAEVHFVDTDIDAYVWEMQCEYADSQNSFIPDCCCQEDEDESCGCDTDSDYSDFVDQNTNSAWEVYDPENEEHYLCSGCESMRDMTLNKAYFKNLKVSQIKRQIDTAYNRIESLEEEIRAKQTLVQTLMMELENA